MAEPDERPLAIIDIDGVVADVRHRLHHLERRPKAWKAFFAAASDDAAHPEGAAILERLATDHEIVFVSGRPAHLRRATTKWLEANGMGGHELVLRRGGDFRPAAVAKRELVEELAQRRTIGIVVDDDPGVVEAMAAAGYPTFLADWERRAPQQEAARHEAQDVEGRT